MLGTSLYNNACFIGILILISNCYVLRQSWGQLELIRKRKPIQSVLVDPNTPQAVRQKLLYVEQVRHFIQKRMQLRIDKTFQYYTQLDRDELAWNVSASQKLKFQAKTWWFPIVGRVPYLGYFEYTDAKNKATELRKEGWDVRIGSIAAYSTLGWFDDPLISTQLSYSKWYLANLLIHECAHANLWFQDNVGFNESFASFVGREGALQFYKEHFGIKAYQKQINLFKARKKAYLIYYKYTQRLEKIYTSQLDDTQKLERKAMTIFALEKELAKQGFAPPPKKNNLRLNNADLLSYRRYSSGSNYFKNKFIACQSNWQCFLSEMKALQKLTAKQRNYLIKK